MVGWSLCQGSAIGLSLVLSVTIEAPLKRYFREAENVSATAAGRFWGNGSHMQKDQTSLCQVELSANETYNVYSQGLAFKLSKKLRDRLVEAQVPTVHPNRMSCNCVYLQEEIVPR